MAGLGFNVWDRAHADFTSTFANLAFVCLPSVVSGLVLFCVACRTTETYGLRIRKKTLPTLKLLQFLVTGIFALSTIFFKRNENSYELVSYCILSLVVMGIGGYDYLNEEVEISVVVDGLSFFLALANVVQFRTNLWVFLKVEAYSDKKLDSLMHMLLFISLFFLCIVRSVNIFACCCCCRRRSISKKAERVLNASSTQYEKIDSEGHHEMGTSDFEVLSEDRANLFQRFYFCWIVPMLRIGYGKGQLEMSDLPALATCDEPTALFNKYIGLWNKQYAMKGKALSLANVLYKSVAYRFWKSGFLLFLGQSASILVPVLTHELLTILETREDTTADKTLFEKGGSLEYLVVLVVLLTFMSAMASILTHQFWIVGVRVSMHCQLLLQTHVLNKVMVLSHRSRSGTTEGEMSNLISSDATKIATSYWGCMFHWGGWCSVTTIVIAMYNLHSLLGYGAYAGVLVIIVFMPTSYFLSKHIKVAYKEMMSFRDKRGKRMVENLRAIRVVKAFGAENSTWLEIDEVRQQELRWQRYQQMLNICNIVLSSIGPVLVNAVSFLVFSILGGKVTAAKIFTSLLWFALLQSSMVRIPGTITSTVNVLGSLERLQNFLLLEESKVVQEQTNSSTCYLKVKNCTFGWYSKNVQSNIGEGPSGVKPVVKHVNFEATGGDLICVLGAVGCGKSSLLAGLTNNNVRLGGSLQRHGKIAFVNQRPWLRNASILENIIDFDSATTGFDGVVKTDDIKLQQCVDACALQPDIDVFPNGLDTPVGSNGVTLSGGQRQRISLARAVYADADIYIFDDVLSAVDEEVAKHIFKKCIVDILLKRKKIVILATHAEQYVRGNPSVAGLYTIDSDGEFKAVSVDNFKDTITKPAVTQEQAVSVSANKSKRLQEERKKGYVSLHDVKQYIHAFGVCTSVVLFLLFTIRQALTIAQQFWLTVWVRSSDPTSTFFVYIYGVLGIALVVLTAITCYFIVTGSISGAKIMHDKAMKAILRSRVMFFDTTPFGVIVNRMLNDIAKIDSIMSTAIVGLVMALFQVLSTVGVVIFVTPYVIIMVLLLLWPYYICGLYYRWSSRELRRLTSTTRSPIITTFSETVTGIDTIRAYGAEDSTFRRYTGTLRENARAYLMSWAANQWVTAVLEAMGVLVIFISTGGAVYIHLFRNGVDPSLIGFCLTYTLNLPSALMWLIRNLATAETELVAVERIVEYSQIEAEDENVIFSSRKSAYKSDKASETFSQVLKDDTKSTSLLRNHAAFEPNVDDVLDGRLEFVNVTMSYRRNLKPVLKKVNFVIDGGKKVAIIGRTGAGKSSIFMALLRFYACENGSAIYLNGKNIVSGYHDISEYRKNIAYVPQEAVLLSGTLRTSLTKHCTPDQPSNDELIWDVLEKVKMKAKIKSMENGLDTEVVEGGVNFSHGERQLLCLARALLNKRASVVLADEATANIDHSSELLVQQVVLGLPMTVLYICHRLVNLNQFDLVMVMENGEVNKICKPEDHLVGANK